MTTSQSHIGAGEVLVVGDRFPLRPALILAGGTAWEGGVQEEEAAWRAGFRHIQPRGEDQGPGSSGSHMYAQHSQPPCTQEETGQRATGWRSKATGSWGLPSGRPPGSQG